MTDPLHLEEVHVIANLCQDVQQLQCVGAETATPETDRRSKHLPLITLCAVKRVLMEQVCGKRNIELLLCMISQYCAYSKKYFASDVCPYTHLH